MKTAIKVDELELDGSMGRFLNNMTWGENSGCKVIHIPCKKLKTPKRIGGEGGRVGGIGEGGKIISKNV